RGSRRRSPPGAPPDGRLVRRLPAPRRALAGLALQGAGPDGGRRPARDRGVRPPPHDGAGRARKRSRPRLTDERSLRVAEAARRSHADFALLTSFDTVCYATGFEVPIEIGPMPFEGGPPTALVARDGTTGLVVVNIEE